MARRTVRSAHTAVSWYRVPELVGDRDDGGDLTSAAETTQ
jgi:hypothetical protein